MTSGLKRFLPLLILMVSGGLGFAASAPAWQTRTGGRVAAVQPEGAGRPGFTRMAALSLGITFTNRVADDRTVTNRNLLSGS